MDYDAKLEELYIDLQEPPSEKGNTQAVSLEGRTLRIAGAVPYASGRIHCQGRVGIEVKTDTAKLAARTAAVMVLSYARHALGGSLKRIKRLASVEGFIACGAEFKDHNRVLDGASDLFAEIFGPAGKHLRTAVGVVSLPQNACLSINATFELR